MSFTVRANSSGYRALWEYISRTIPVEYQQPCPLSYSGYSAGGCFYTYYKRPQVYSRVAIRSGYSADGCLTFGSEHTASLSSDTRMTLLLLSCRRRDRLNIVEFGFGVRELLILFYLQAPVFVGNDVYDDDRLAVHLNPD
jgi:hypothetical protein